MKEKRVTFRFIKLNVNVHPKPFGEGLLSWAEVRSPSFQVNIYKIKAKTHDYHEKLNGRVSLRIAELFKT